MKKLIKKLGYLFVLLIFQSFISFGQTLRILKDNSDVTGQTITIPVVAGESVETIFSIYNASNDTLKYQVNRTILNPPMNSPCAKLYFCSGKLCFPPASSVTWTPNVAPIIIKPLETMPNGNGTFGIIAHYDVCLNQCNDLFVLYRVYNVRANTSDTSFFQIRYSCSANGVSENKEKGDFFISTFPNPIEGNIGVIYNLKDYSQGEVSIVNIIGDEIEKRCLKNNQGIINIDLSMYPSGIYFCSLVVGNQKMGTKKIIKQ